MVFIYFDFIHDNHICRGSEEDEIDEKSKGRKYTAGNRSKIICITNNHKEENEPKRWTCPLGQGRWEERKMYREVI